MEKRRARSVGSWFPGFSTCRTCNGKIVKPETCADHLQRIDSVWYRGFCTKRCLREWENTVQVLGGWAVPPDCAPAAFGENGDEGRAGTNEGAHA